MKKIELPTGRPFDRRVFWVLVGLSVPAAFAIIPFANNLRSAYNLTDHNAVSGWAMIVVDRVVSIAFAALLGGIGLAIANRIGLGLPFIEAWIRREPTPCRFRSIVAIGMVVGILCAALILVLDAGVFAKPMQAMFVAENLPAPERNVAPPLAGFGAAVSAGITEEIMFRLFGLSLLAWLGSLLFRRDDGRPGLAVLWTANVLFALVFAAAHLTSAHAIGWPINGLVLTRTFLLNGIAGLAFGWLFWTWGLESAMLAHFFTDVGLYVLLSIVILRETSTGRIAAVVGVGIVVVAGVVWAARTIRQESSALSDCS